MRRSQHVWSKLYKRAVLEDAKHWGLGCRIGDLERQVDGQRERLEALVETVARLPARALPDRGSVRGSEISSSGGGGEVVDALVMGKVLSVEQDMNELVTVMCAARPDKYLQVSGSRGRCVRRAHAMI